jgi:hypothetical protein
MFSYFSDKKLSDKEGIEKTLKELNKYLLKNKYEDYISGNIAE